MCHTLLYNKILRSYIIDVYNNTSSMCLTYAIYIYIMLYTVKLLCIY